ncbi:MAG TPA: helix-turn-helix transcriptional regulator [Terriglobales bacterium]|nr:helix-turn-helix transcriptional regulator [Terriglobales bacterium]
MDGMTLKEARLGRKWSQQQAARRLGVTQAYLSMMEKGRRAVPQPFVRKALKALKLPATALPLPSEDRLLRVEQAKHDFSAELGSLGYPGFAYLAKKTKVNPALLLFDALNEADLDSRVAEGLPWLALKYADMDWNWLVRNARVSNRQNRLGFAVALAVELANPDSPSDGSRLQKLRDCLLSLEASRLAGEDTFCHESMTDTERAWLRETRSSVAAHWNLLTDLRKEHLAYASK